MGRRKLYNTPEERAEAKRRWRKNASDATKAKRAAYLLTETGKALRDATYARYRQTDKYREAQRRYRESQKAKATDAAYLARQKLVNPERVKARAAIAILLRKGTLVKPTRCDGCGAEKPLDAHHHLGYKVENWLNVHWFCRTCHAAAHS